MLLLLSSSSFCSTPPFLHFTVSSFFSSSANVVQLPHILTFTCTASHSHLDPLLRCQPSLDHLHNRRVLCLPGLTFACDLVMQGRLDLSYNQNLSVDLSSRAPIHHTYLDLSSDHVGQSVLPHLCGDGLNGCQVHQVLLQGRLPPGHQGLRRGQLQDRQSFSYRAACRLDQARLVRCHHTGWRALQAVQGCP